MGERRRGGGRRSHTDGRWKWSAAIFVRFPADPECVPRTGARSHPRAGLDRRPVTPGGIALKASVANPQCRFDLPAFVRRRAKLWVAGANVRFCVRLRRVVDRANDLGDVFIKRRGALKPDGQWSGRQSADKRRSTLFRLSQSDGILIPKLRRRARWSVLQSCRRILRHRSDVAGTRFAGLEVCCCATGSHPWLSARGFRRDHIWTLLVEIRSLVASSLPGLSGGLVVDHLGASRPICLSCTPRFVAGHSRPQRPDGRRLSR